MISKVAEKLKEAATELRKLGSENAELLEKQASLKAENDTLKEQLAAERKVKLASSLYDTHVNTVGIDVPKDVFVKNATAEMSEEQMTAKIDLLNDIHGITSKSSKFAATYVKKEQNPAEAFADGVESVTKAH